MIIVWILAVALVVYLAGVAAVALYLIPRFGPYAGPLLGAILSVALRWPDAVLNRLFP